MRNKSRNKDGSYEDSLFMAWMNPAYIFNNTFRKLS
jgi:hypothetical protein